MPNQTACHCGCGYDSPHPLVQEVFDWCNAQGYKVSSVCRCPQRNKTEGGVKNSQHLCGKAIDIHHDMPDQKFFTFITEMKPSFTLEYTWGTHVDFRGK